MLISLLEAAELLRQGKVSPVELTRDCLARIEKLNPALNAFVAVTAEDAIKQARKAEEDIRRGRWRGPLHGVPIGLKDIIDTAGLPTTAASELFRDRIPAEDADVTRRLKSAGAVFLGKQNLHEFAYGGSSVISCFGEVHNPWDLECIAGGSSGGSAAAVAAGLGYAAIGTDTAGSVREPAAQCGVVGLKPTYARVSASGVIPLSVSLDHVGPLTRTVADAAAVLQATVDPHAPAVGGRRGEIEDYVAALKAPTNKLRIGVPREFFFEDLDADVAAAVEKAISVIAGMTAELREVALDVSLDRTLQSAESYEYHKQWVDKTPELYHPETLRRIRTGAKWTPQELEQSRTDLEQSRRKIADVFRDIDLLVMPAVPVPAPRIADLKPYDERLRPREIVLLRNTRPINVWGLPAISVPCGLSRSGLPIGLQIVGAHWNEAMVLQLAHAYEQATEWHKLKPPIVKRLETTASSPSR
jgi:aspartyl-tRNA(Asn)/glutamyl-tRNA(Gln) amidotransferase subunit A